VIAPDALCAPNRAPPGPPHLREGGEREEALKSPERVLVVEDNWLVAVEMEATLEDAGYEVVGIAVSAEEAVQACNAERPDLVLMDIRLLGPRDGIDAALEIRERFGIGSIFVSAHDDADVRMRAETARPLGWIVKPVTGRELIRSLAALSDDDGE
jgi:two-component system, response regulator PdtaR